MLRWHAARDERVAGHTFHLADPAPLLAREVYDAVLTRRTPRSRAGTSPARSARGVARLGIARLDPGRSRSSTPRSPVRYDATNTERVLAGTGVRCPPLADYLSRLVRYVLDVSRPVAIPHEDEVSDPLAQRLNRRSRSFVFQMS